MMSKYLNSTDDPLVLGWSDDARRDREAGGDWRALASVLDCVSHAEAASSPRAPDPEFPTVLALHLVLSFPGVGCWRLLDAGWAATFFRRHLPSWSHYGSTISPPPTLVPGQSPKFVSDCEAAVLWGRFLLGGVI
jgi:hypothetical protein